MKIWFYVINVPQGIDTISFNIRNSGFDYNISFPTSLLEYPISPDNCPSSGELRIMGRTISGWTESTASSFTNLRNGCSYNIDFATARVTLKEEPLLPIWLPWEGPPLPRTVFPPWPWNKKFSIPLPQF